MTKNKGGALEASAGAPKFANRTMWTGVNIEILRRLNSESINLIRSAGRATWTARELAE